MPQPEVFENALVYGTTTYLTEPCSSDDLEIQVQIPAAPKLQLGKFRVLLFDPQTGAIELAMVTLASTTTWTIERGIENTTPKDFGPNSLVKHIMTASLAEGVPAGAPGSPGEPGPPGPPGANFKGTYVGITPYSQGDWVFSDDPDDQESYNSLPAGIGSNTGHSPSSDNGSHWKSWLPRPAVKQINRIDLCRDYDFRPGTNVLPAWQQALDDWIAGGKHRRYYCSIPGIYLFSGPQATPVTALGYTTNGQSLIAPRDWSNGPASLLLEGNMPIPSIYHDNAEIVDAGGVVFLTDAIDGWVIDSIPAFTASGPKNDIFITVKDIAIRLPADPQCGFINASNIGRFALAGTGLIAPDVLGDSITTLPTGTREGIVMPKTSNLTISRIDKQWEFFGLPTAIRHGENTYIDAAKIHKCGTAIKFNGGTGHISRYRVLQILECQVGIDADGIGGRVEGTITRENSGSSAFAETNFIKDPTHLIKGVLRVTPTTTPNGQQLQGSFPGSAGLNLGLVNLNNGGDSWQTHDPSDDFLRSTYNGDDVGFADQWFHPYITVGSGTCAVSQGQVKSTSALDVKRVLPQSARKHSRTIRMEFKLDVGGVAYSSGLFFNYIPGVTGRVAQNASNGLSAIVSAGKLVLQKYIAGTLFPLYTSPINVAGLPSTANGSSWILEIDTQRSADSWTLIPRLKLVVDVNATTVASGTGAVATLTTAPLISAIPSGAQFIIKGDPNATPIVFTTTAIGNIGDVALSVSASASVTTTIPAGAIEPAVTAASGTGAVTHLTMNLPYALPAGSQFRIKGDTNSPGILFTVPTFQAAGTVSVSVTPSVPITTTIASNRIIMQSVPITTFLLDPVNDVPDLTTDDAQEFIGDGFRLNNDQGTIITKISSRVKSAPTLGRISGLAADGADTEYGFSSWKALIDLQGGNTSTAAVAGTFLMGGGALPSLGGVGSALGRLRLDPARYAAGGRVPYIQVLGEVLPNSVAPSGNIKIGLYPITAYGGASGAAPTITALGAAVCVSANIALPAADTPLDIQVPVTAFPVAGDYILAAITDTNLPAGATLLIRARIQFQQV